MQQVGWIKVHRKITGHWLWDEKPFDKFHAWQDMLLEANFQDKKMMVDGKLLLVKRGSYLTSIRKLSEKWGWHRNTVKAFLTTLQEDGMISYECTSKCTTINIVNYEVYQGLDDTECTTDYATECTTECTTDYATECTQNKNIKNVKNDKNIYNARTRTHARGNRFNTFESREYPDSFFEALERIKTQ